MIDIAESVTPPAEKIDYWCADLTAFGRDTLALFDLVVLSNSFFHIDDKHLLLAEVRRRLTHSGYVAFSLYDSVFRPTDPLAWPMASTGPDTLMEQLLAELRRRGHQVSARQEDRQILTEPDLADLFAGHGFKLSCAGALRLRRGPHERLAFFRLPAVAAEVFPDLDPAAVAAAIDSLDIPVEPPAQERLVYAFTARRNHSPAGKA
jgi:SAM-dependent methyltransferase